MSVNQSLLADDASAYNDGEISLGISSEPTGADNNVMENTHRKHSIPHDDDSQSDGWLSYFDLGFTSHAGKWGTYFGFFILVVTMVASVMTQAYNPEDVDVKTAWLAGCPIGYHDSCLANQAVLRYSFALVVLFTLQLLMTCTAARLYDRYWLYKTLIFISTLIGFFYADASVFNNEGYAWFARVGGFFFILLQQVILLDFALSWNETWIAKSNTENTLNSVAGGYDRWQIAILCTGFGLLIFSLVAISLMFKHFGGCSSNNLILSLGLITSILGFIYQMTMTRIGSVLTSGVMSAYYAYICFSSITLNPDHSCNPTIARSPQTWTTVIGLFITILSLSWTTYSTIKALPAQSLSETVTPDNGNAYAHPGLRTIFASVCVIFILGSCYYAMVLTNWATQQQNFSMGNSRIGETAMWLQSSAGWCCFCMYIWALTAPMIWPERFGLAPHY
jgi:serine incorporator 1/3